MSHATLTDKHLITLLPKENIAVLDVGHGYGQIGLLIQSHTMGKCVLWGIDIYKPYHLLQKKLKIYDHLILGNAVDTPLPEAVGYSIASHVIEHLEKEDGYKLIEKLEQISSEAVIIITPKGLVPAEEKDGNIHNIHKSGWSREDFTKLGYKVTPTSLTLNSNAVRMFSEFWYRLRGKPGLNTVLVAIKTLRNV